MFTPAGSSPVNEAWSMLVCCPSTKSSAASISMPDAPATREAMPILPSVPPVLKVNGDPAEKAEPQASREASAMHRTGVWSERFMDASLVEKWEKSIDGKRSHNTWRTAR